MASGKQPRKVQGAADSGDEDDILVAAKEREGDGSTVQAGRVVAERVVALYFCRWGEDRDSWEGG